MTVEAPGSCNEAPHGAAVDGDVADGRGGQVDGGCGLQLVDQMLPTDCKSKLNNPQGTSLQHLQWAGHAQLLLAQAWPPVDLDA